MSVLSIWTVYERPSDYPNSYVARRYDIGPNSVEPTGDLIVAPTIDLIRSQLPEGVVRLDPHPIDDANIVESWL